MAEDNLTETNWKDKMTERWKLRPPHFLNLKVESLTLERLTIPRSITEVIKEDIYYPINIEIEAPPANQSNKKNICQNSKLECLNKDYFDMFYEDYLDFENYILFCA